MLIDLRVLAPEYQDFTRRVNAVDGRETPLDHVDPGWLATLFIVCGHGLHVVGHEDWDELLRTDDSLKGIEKADVIKRCVEISMSILLASDIFIHPSLQGFRALILLQDFFVRTSPSPHAVHAFTPTLQSLADRLGLSQDPLHPSAPCLDADLERSDQEENAELKRRCYYALLRLSCGAPFLRVFMPVHLTCPPQYTYPQRDSSGAEDHFEQSVRLSSLMFAFQSAHYSASRSPVTSSSRAGKRGLSSRKLDEFVHALDDIEHSMSETLKVRTDESGELAEEILADARWFNLSLSVAFLVLLLPYSSIESAEGDEKQRGFRDRIRRHAITIILLLERDERIDRCVILQTYSSMAANALALDVLVEPYSKESDRERLLVQRTLELWSNVDAAFAIMERAKAVVECLVKVAEMRRSIST
ncbi:hypothetical protein BT69DRAFT_381024 [Atractiella rhizophila]|nr:hypothetical protein BT69DRAFT_381024 [Atractiella rhizophila]